MTLEQNQTCCFTGHRPAKLPWGSNEDDPRCLALKQSIYRELESLYRRGYRHFISGMALGCDLYFAEAVLELNQRYHDISLEAAVPFPGQADRWSEANRARRQAVLAHCDLETVVQDHYDRDCMHRRDRYMVDRSAAVLSVFADSPGGTRYTLEYAAKKRLDILLLDLNNPGSSAVRMTCEKVENFSFFPIDK